MLQQTQTTQTETGEEQVTNGKNPDLIAYDVRDRENDKKGIWNRVGAVWFHKDGKGADVIYSSVSLSGRMVLRERIEKSDQ